MNEKGTVYFFTGLAGAGKTTIGGLFYQRLKSQKPEVVLIDGDQTRTQAGHSSADGTVLQEDCYTTEARKGGARWAFRQCRELAEEGKDVVICSIAMYTEIRAWNRENIEKIFNSLKFTFQKVGMVKYDAFHEMGGKLSFSLALLDQKNDGFIINAMHSREGCYTYIKEILSGNSIIVLADEEKEALDIAMGVKKSNKLAED